MRVGGAGAATAEGCVGRKARTIPCLVDSLACCYRACDRTAESAGRGIAKGEVDHAGWIGTLVDSQACCWRTCDRTVESSG
eukprot:7983873-Prorocentrum_lima.AAC.1